MKMLSFSALSLLLCISLLTASPHDPKGAKITKNEAEHIALKLYPGARVTAAKLERGKRTLVWSIEVSRSHAKPVAVAVDAKTGHIVPGTRETR